MFGYDDGEGHLSSVARSCKLLSPRSSTSAANSEEGISCSICRNWDGSGCTRKVFDGIMTQLEMD